MRPVMTLEDFERDLHNRHGDRDKNVVALMLAPYNQQGVKRIVDQYYHTWHLQCGGDLDMFWIGYGSSFDKGDYVMKLELAESNPENIHFDLNRFLEGEKAINNRCHFIYHEDFELLLFNYEHGHVNYYDHFRIDLQSSLLHERDLRELISMIIDFTKDGKSINRLKNEIKLKLNLKRLKKVKINDLLGYLKQAGMLG